jgi:4-alpha-methyl-delta7-sterol-4alpha-methyl oxidase
MEAFADPRFVPVVLVGTAISMGSFLAFALPMTLVAALGPAWAEPWRVQAKRADVRRWFWPSIGRWLSNSAALLALLTVLWPVVRLGLRIRLDAPPGMAEVLVSLIAFSYADDLAFYFLHRALHQGWLYRQIHSVHHRILTPMAISGHYMHPLDFIATGLLMLVWPNLAGAHVWTLYAWIVLRQLEASEGHCGYHLPFSPLSLLPGNHGADAHDFHHSKFVGNYSGFFAWVDAAMGTSSKGYLTHAAARGLRWVSWLPGTEVRAPQDPGA